MILTNKRVFELQKHLNEINKEISANIACFTGHRPQKLPWGFNENDERCKEMKNQTKIKIEESIKNGYHTFLCGMALGFDMICAEIVLALKKQYPFIKLIGALPCKTQSDGWKLYQKERYFNLLKQLDAVRCIYDTYIGKECMHERNRYMINNSSLVIALFNGKSGGTKQTLDYAKSQGLKIEIIKP